MYRPHFKFEIPYDNPRDIGSHVQTSDDGQLADIIQAITQDEAQPHKHLVGIDALHIVAGLLVLNGEPIASFIVDEWPHDACKDQTPLPCVNELPKSHRAWLVKTPAILRYE